ncbi:MAG: 50S ribosomal protein L15 [Candidatus Omnitrophica bacterium]|nr:50S ribosomal protein L15 [Candidatus Omnitrophota bacterium]
MDLSKLTPAYGSTKKTKRRGRGQGSGHGKTSCRGHKGEKARSGGGGTHRGFEGGQMTLIRRLPKFGFSKVKMVYQIVNLAGLKDFSVNSIVSIEELKKQGLIRHLNRPVKVLGIGDIDISLTVKANAFSKSAKEKIEKAGGKVEIVSNNK